MKRLGTRRNCPKRFHLRHSTESRRRCKSSVRATSHYLLSILSSLRSTNISPTDLGFYTIFSGVITSFYEGRNCSFSVYIGCDFVVLPRFFGNDFL